jgi:hypothetical protein
MFAIILNLSFGRSTARLNISIIDFETIKDSCSFEFNATAY